MLPTWIQPLEWDSQFFGFPVFALQTDQLPAEVALHEVAEAVIHAGAAVTYIQLGPSHPLAHQLQQAGYPVWDRKRVYLQDPIGKPADFLDSEFIIQGWDNRVTPELLDLAVICGEYSRFKLDPAFQDDAFVALYHRWMARSIRGEIAIQTFVALDSLRQPVGVLTLGQKNNRADIGLLGVAEKARGNKLAQRLIAAAQTEALTRGFTQLQVVTQGQNMPACRLYESAGFALEQETLVFHLWRKQMTKQ